MEKNHAKHGIMAILVHGIHRCSWYFNRNKESSIRDGLMGKGKSLTKTMGRKPEIYVKATKNMTSDEGKSPS